MENVKIVRAVHSKRYDSIIALATKWLRILSLGGNTNVAKSSVKYLDHIMEKNGVRSGRDNLRAIREFERLKDKKM